MATADRFPGAGFSQVTARPRTLAVTAPAQPQRVSGGGFQIVSVDHDAGSGQWQVDFRAGDRLYRYHVDRSPNAHALQVCDGATWATISTGAQTPLAVESVLEHMAGLGIPYRTFRWGYESWYIGFVSGWCAAEEQGRAEVDF